MNSENNELNNVSNQPVIDSLDLEDDNEVLNVQTPDSSNDIDSLDDLLGDVQVTNVNNNVLETQEEVPLPVEATEIPVVEKTSDNQPFVDELLIDNDVVSPNVEELSIDNFVEPIPTEINTQQESINDAQNDEVLQLDEPQNISDNIDSNSSNSSVPEEKIDEEKKEENNSFILPPASETKVVANSPFIKTTEDLRNAVPNPELMISSMANAIPTDEELLKLYVGNKYDEFTTKKFNVTSLIVSLFFGPMYLFTRKLYGMGILYTILLILLELLLCIIMPFLVVLAPLIMAIVVSLFFNKLYINKAKNKVIKLKNNNKNKTAEDLRKICAKKGGKNILIAILLELLVNTLVIIITFILLIIIVGSQFTKFVNDTFGIKINVILNDSSNNTTSDSSIKVNNTKYNGVIKYDETIDIESVIMDIPTYYKPTDLNFNYVRSYAYATEEKPVCEFTFGLVKNYSKSDSLINEIGEYNGINQTDIFKATNEQDWNIVEVDHQGTKTKYAAISKNDKVYLLTFELKSEVDYDFCDNTYKRLLNSAEFTE